ncbi:MAG: SUMF1/EgtB/PvdO family nonheme iron enzyme [bacterium]
MRANSESSRHDVGQKDPNSWGLYDMHGNVWEWVWDGYRDDYQNLPSEDPVYDVGPGVDRAYRGGRWLNIAGDCRSAHRAYGSPGGTGFKGFRPARSAN